MDREAATDADLLRAAGEDPEAFGLVYDRHVAVIMGFLYQRTRSLDAAAELTAETFARAYIARGGFRVQGTESSARPWLIGIAARELAKAVRRRRIDDRARRKLEVVSVTVADDEFERVEERLSSAELQEAVRTALAQLSESVARAVWLRVALDLPYERVAQQLGCSEGAARVRVTRGLGRLRYLMGVR